MKSPITLLHTIPPPPSPPPPDTRNSKRRSIMGNIKSGYELANVNLQGFSSKVESMYFGLEDGRQANKFLVSCQPVRPLVADGRRRAETGIRLFEYAK